MCNTVNTDEQRFGLIQLQPVLSDCPSDPNKTALLAIHHDNLQEMLRISKLPFAMHVYVDKCSFEQKDTDMTLLTWHCGIRMCLYSIPETQDRT